LTAAGVAIGFLVLGQAVLSLLGITVHDFMIAGGILLFGIAFSDILSSEKPQRAVDPESLGAVPLGVPLICGPAVLTTSLLLQQRYGYAPAGAAIMVNVALTGALLSLAPRIHRVLGKAGAKTVSKIASLLLAAIAVMMVRHGLTHFIAPGA
ncbi:MAG TPA: MarC family protein, partial [Candidatus Brocadiia bacterium]|nr:MarC family protein [Candidatus Brocadiia bacterium]